MWEHTYIESLIYGRPLMIERNALRVITIVLAARRGMEPPLIVAAPVPERPPREVAPAPTADGIAVIEVMGKLVHRTRGIQADSGMASYETIGQELMLAARDPRIGGILLHIDSPGGEVAGAYPLAHIVSQVASEKPVWAVVDEAAWSAGYLIASQSSRILLSENGSVGSIGICLIHCDQSGRDAQAGDEYTFLYRGDRKNDFNPHGPLSDGAKKFANQILDREYSMFVDYVSRARKLSADKVRDTEAALIYGKDAIDSGFADDFLTYTDAAVEMSNQLRGGTSVILSNSTKGERSVADKPTEEAPVPEPKMTGVLLPLPPPQGATAPAPTTLTAADFEEIAAACILARKPHLTAQFIREHKTVAEVKKILLDSAASEDEQTETISAFPPSHGAEAPQAKPKMSLAQRMAEHLGIKYGGTHA